MRDRVARRAVRCYPRRWRDRYEAELCALLDDAPPSRRAAWDLASGAAREWFDHLTLRHFAEKHAIVKWLRAVLGAVLLAWFAAIATQLTFNLLLIAVGVAGVAFGLVHVPAAVLHPFGHFLAGVWQTSLRNTWTLSTLSMVLVGYGMLAASPVVVALHLWPVARRHVWLCRLTTLAIMAGVGLTLGTREAAMWASVPALALACGLFPGGARSVSPTTSRAM